MRLTTLIIAPSRESARELAQELRSAGLDPDWQHSTDLDSLNATLAALDIDLILCRTSTPNLDPGTALRAALAHDPPPPVLAVSGTLDAARVHDVIPGGPAGNTLGPEQDGYVCLEDPEDLARAALRAVNESRAREEQRRREKLLKFRHYFMEKAQEAILWVESTGRVFYANQAALGLMGADPGHLPRLNLASLLAAQSAASFPTLWQELAQAGGKTWSERLLTLSGETRDVDISADHLLLEGEECAVVYLRDTTELKRAKTRLEQTLREKQAVFSSMEDGILTVDTDLAVLDHNQALTEVCPMARHIAPGRDLTAPAHKDCPCITALAATLGSREPVRESHVACSAEPHRRLDLTATPLMADEHTFAGAVLLARDVTRLHDLEQRIHGPKGAMGMVGNSPSMLRTFDLLTQVAQLDSLVLLRGESGTGKELAAEALHKASPRASGPLVEVNCSALSENLLESELFGHVKGAFSGAIQDREGRIHAAQSGTLLLDEIGDLSPTVQLKLLRFMESK
ncbi:MAG: PAS domain-containing protein, partial [Desulfovibrio sp.]